MMVNNQRGMSLIEMMAVTAISFIVLAGVMQLMLDASRVQSRLRTVGSIQRELSDLQVALARPDACAAQLSGVSFLINGNLLDIPPVAPATVNPLTMSFHGDEGVKLMTSKIRSLKKLDTYVLSATQTFERHLGQLEFGFEASQDSIGGSGLKTRTMPLQVLVDIGTGKIVNCQTNLGDVGVYCTLIGGTYDPTKVPPCELPVFQNVCAPGTVAERIAAGGIVCITPPDPPSGPPVDPDPPLDQVYIDVRAFACSAPNPCDCPAQYPWYVTGGLPGVSITCMGYQTVPPGYTLGQVQACIAAGDPTHNYCVRLGGHVIQVGFGPCYDCP